MRKIILNTNFKGLQTEIYKSGSDVNVTWICPYAISTGLFDGFKAAKPWIIDILTPEYVSDQIIYSIETNADRVFLPKILSVVYALNAMMPRAVGLPLLKWGGVLDCMNNVSILLTLMPIVFYSF